MVDTIVDNTTAIEKLGQTVEKIKPKVYTFKNHYYFPSVGEEFVSKITTNDQGEEHDGKQEYYPEEHRKGSVPDKGNNYIMRLHDCGIRLG